MGQVSGRAIDADLAQSDPDIASFINQERQRQETHLELIASENFASRAVMQAQGCLLYTSPSPRDMRRSRMPSSA